MKEAIQIAGDVLVKPFEGYAKRLPNGDCTAYPDPGSPPVPVPTSNPAPSGLSRKHKQNLIIIYCIFVTEY